MQVGSSPVWVVMGKSGMLCVYITMYKKYLWRFV
nr:MAG TPA: hypothetical protein [Caudoviricetes sp.]